jgi:aspartate racemase
VLGCTELCLILSPNDVPLPVFDTTALHAMAAVDFALPEYDANDGQKRNQLLAESAV